MSEVENLMPECRKRFQAQMVRFQDKLDHVAADRRGDNHHIAAFMNSDFAQNAGIAAMKLRLERIERRPDLID